LPQDTTYGSEVMAGRTWYWRAQPKPTQFNAVQLEITVAQTEGKEADGVVSVLGILDTSHRLP
jgi:hypothetical protein